MSDETAIDTDAFLRRLRRRMTLNSLSPFEGVDLRTATSLIADGVLTSEMPRIDVAPNIAEIVKSADHPDRIPTPLGPMVAHRARMDAPPSLEYPASFLLSDERSVRDAALTHFTHLLQSNPGLLSTRVAKLLDDLAVALLSDVRSDWTKPALQLGDALEEDIPLNLAGIAQCVSIGFPKGIPDFLQHALRPSRLAVDSLLIPFPCPTGQRDEISRFISTVAASSAEIVTICEAFFAKCGHLPLSAGFGLPAVVTAWKLLHPGAKYADDLLQWATTHNSAYARFHAVTVFLTHPQDLPDTQWNTVAQYLADIVGSFEPESTESHLSIPWELRNDLAHHYLQYLEPLIPGQDERITSLAWWLADRAAISFGKDEAFLSRLRNLTIQQAETRSSHMWLLCRPPCQPSALRFATLNLRSPWAYAVLSALTAESAQTLVQHGDIELVKRIAIAYTRCIFYPTFTFPADQPSVVCGDGRSICHAAIHLAAVGGTTKETEQLARISELGVGLLDLQTIIDAIRSFHELEEESQIMFFGALRTLIHYDPNAANDLWKILQDPEWRERFFAEAPLAAAESLSDSIALLAGNPDRWRAFGPHMFALGAMRADSSPERRQAFFALTVLLALAAGGTSAIQRMLQSKQRVLFRKDIAYWRARMLEALPMASPWAQGRLRATLAALHVVL